MNEDIERILEHYLFEYPSVQTKLEIVSLLQAYMNAQQVVGLVRDFNVEDTSYLDPNSDFMMFRISYQKPREQGYIYLDITMTSDGVKQVLAPKKHINKHNFDGRV